MSDATGQDAGQAGGADEREASDAERATTPPATSTRAAIVERVSFTTWRDTAHGLSHVRVNVNDGFVGSLTMTDTQLLTFAEFINPSRSGRSGS